MKKKKRLQKNYIPADKYLKFTDELLRKILNKTLFNKSNKSK